MFAVAFETFEMDFVKIFFFFCFAISISSEDRQRLKSFDTEKDFSIYTDDALLYIKTKLSVLQCTALCTDDNNCFSAVSTNATGLCKLYSDPCPMRQYSLGTLLILKNQVKPMIGNPGVCPNGWTAFEDDCYQLHCYMANFVTAKKICEALGSHVVNIDNPKEELWITQNMVCSSQYHQAIWTDINDSQNEGLWLHDTNCRRPKYANWADSEPNSYFGELEDCVSMDNRRGFKLNDELCTGLNTFICKMRQV